MSPAHPGIIAGVVLDEHGAPIRDARVYFTDAPASFPDVAALTAADGSFSLSALVDGTYTIECSAEGFATASATITSPNGADIQIRLQHARSGP